MEETRFSKCMGRIKSGDKNALHEVYEEYIGYIYSIVLQVVQNREDAEDITSEFFIKLWKLADTYEEGGGHRAWLATIARNMAIDFLRKNKRELLLEEPDDGRMENPSNDNIEESVIADISLKEALGNLKNNEREIMNLKIMGGLTFQEIADILRTPIGTVTWRYRNAIDKIRRCGYE